MKAKDKILINAYIDGELSQDESKFVDNLLSESTEAKQFYEELKQVNLEISAFHNDADQVTLNRKIKEFIDDEVRPKLKLENDEVNFFDKIFRASSYNFIGYSATAIIFFGLGSNYLNQVDGLSEFENLDPTFEYLKLRSNQSQDLKEIILDASLKMIDQKTLSSNVEIGEDLYEIDFNFIKEPCYYGSVTQEELIADFVVCSEEEVKNITFID